MGAAMFLAPPDTPDVVYEFFAPFAHVPGKWEWCRIRSPTHGVFDVFIVLGASTQEPATVIVHTQEGAEFMRERYPECATVRVPAFDLHLEEREAGRGLFGRVKAPRGPVREAEMTFRARPGAKPEQTGYGGTGAPVWGSKRFTCWGVDLNLAAEAHGWVRHEDGRLEELRGVPALLTLGSFGRIASLPPDAGAAPRGSSGEPTFGARSSRARDNA